MPVSCSMEKAIIQIAELSAPLQTVWLVGGSCGLLLQGVEVQAPPRDLDLYSDEADARTLAEALRPFATDRLEFNRTEQYESLLSHYEVADTQVELVGQFRVHSASSFYEVKIRDLLDRWAPVVWLGSVELHLMPLAHELVFNVMRNRPDRYNSIADAMKADPSAHIPALLAVIRGNCLSEELIGTLARLTGHPLWKEGA